MSHEGSHTATHEPAPGSEALLGSELKPGLALAQIANYKELLIARETRAHLAAAALAEHTEVGGLAGIDTHAVGAPPTLSESEERIWSDIAELRKSMYEGQTYPGATGLHTAVEGLKNRWESLSASEEPLTESGWVLAEKTENPESQTRTLRFNRPLLDDRLPVHFGSATSLTVTFTADGAMLHRVYFPEETMAWSDGMPRAEVDQTYCFVTKDGQIHSQLRTKGTAVRHGNIANGHSVSLPSTRDAETHDELFTQHDIYNMLTSLTGINEAISQAWSE